MIEVMGSCVVCKQKGKFFYSSVIVGLVSLESPPGVIKCLDSLPTILL